MAGSGFTGEAYERAHESSMQKLIKELGTSREAEIRTAYNIQRASSEETARIRDFLPLTVYSAVKDQLTASKPA